MGEDLVKPVEEKIEAVPAAVEAHIAPAAVKVELRIIEGRQVGIFFSQKLDVISIDPRQALAFSKGLRDLANKLLHAEHERAARAKRK